MSKYSSKYTSAPWELDLDGIIFEILRSGPSNGYVLTSDQVRSVALEAHDHPLYRKTVVEIAEMQYPDSIRRYYDILWETIEGVINMNKLI